MLQRSICAALAAALLFSACAGYNARVKPHVLVLGDGWGDVSTLNPYLSSGWPTIAVTSSLALAYLVRSDERGLPQPDLIERMPTVENGGISGNGLTVTYHLRPKLRWSDGYPFTARDVVFTVRALKDPRNNQASSSPFDNIASASAPNAGTAVIRLRRRESDFTATFLASLYGACILPEHQLRTTLFTNSPFNTKPVGMGPFRVAEWRRASVIRFERNPYYWKGRPRLSEVDYRISGSVQTMEVEYRAHDVQLWDRVPEQFLAVAASQRDSHLQIAYPDAYMHLDLNLRSPLLADVRVRRALRSAIDRRALNRDVTHGYGHVQEGFVAEASSKIFRPIPLNEYDPGRAGQALDQLGWHRGADGIRVRGGMRLAPTLVYAVGDPEQDKIVEVLRHQLRKAGIDLQSRTYDATLLYEPGGILPAKPRAWDIAMFNWYVDPRGAFPIIFSCAAQAPNGQNYTHYCSRRFEALLRSSQNTYDPRAASRLLQEQAQLLVRDVPSIVLYGRAFGFASDAHVHGFRPNGDTPFDHMENVDVY
jgi:peptide/nickel transport system substrate-binding protein